MENRLKILPDYFEEVLNDNKKSELRLNDRNFKVGDIYILCEWYGGFTGRELKIEITHVLENVFGLANKYCVFSFKKVVESN